MMDEKKQSETGPKPISFGEKAQKRGMILRVIIIALSAILIAVGLIGIFANLWGK